MEQYEAAQLVAKQRAFFQSGQTIPVPLRRKLLVRMEKLLRDYEWELVTAVETDIDKAPYETYMMEVRLLYKELKYLQKNLKRLTRVKTIRKKGIFGKGKARVDRRPHGTVLIVSGWSNPLEEALLPAIEALAAGNTVILKPSGRATHVAAVIKRMLADLLPERWLAVVEGGEISVNHLIQARPDFIFFTGRAEHGRQIMRRASRFLIPVALRLGSKSPCLVSESADIDLAARRIVWGKFLNNGQQGTVPDYVLVHESVKTRLMEAMISILRSTYGLDPTHNPEYRRVAHKEAFDRLKQLMNGGRIMWGGRADEETLCIEPTIIDRVRENSPLLKEEVYGPVLPVVGYEDFSVTLARLNAYPTPLCLYLFSKNEEEIDLVTRLGLYGSAAINDTVVQTEDPDFPTGGRGISGFGATRGEAGFKLFTEQRTVYRAGSDRSDIYRYPPFPQKWKHIRKK